MRGEVKKQRTTPKLVGPPQRGASPRLLVECYEGDVRVTLENALAAEAHKVQESVI